VIDQINNSNSEKHENEFSPERKEGIT